MQRKTDKARLRSHVEFLDLVKPFELARVSCSFSILRLRCTLVCKNGLLGLNRATSCFHLLILILIVTLLIEFKSHIPAVFVKPWFLVFDCVDVPSSESPQLPSLLKELKEVKTTLGDNDDVLPRFRDKAKLKWVRKVVAEGVPYI